MESLQYFFCYSRVNSEFVLRLANDLREAGIKIWLDQSDIPVGIRWDNAIQDALTNSGALIVVLSADAVQSQNVLDEVNYAIEYKKSIITLMYETCQPPYRIARFQYIDFRNNYETGLQDLIRTIKKEKAHPDKPTFWGKAPNGKDRKKRMILYVMASLILTLLVSISYFKFVSQKNPFSSKEQNAILIDTIIPVANNVFPNLAPDLSIRDREGYKQSFENEKADELQLSRLGEQAFLRSDYEWSKNFFRQCRIIQVSKVWMTKYPFYAGAYFMTNHSDSAAMLLDEMYYQLRQPETFLHNEAPVQMLLSALNTVRAKVAVNDKAVMDQYIDLVALKQKEIAETR